ncbi:MAG: hypothetical protein K6G22_12265, partial [Lachnospiraceae bacterium]|nr:hypothetical protein [Lachnospiraceae bacterium]
MSLFEEQIKQRKQYSDDAFAEAFYRVADAVTGKNVALSMQNDAAATRDAIEAVMKYYRVRPKEIPSSITDVYEQLDYLIRPEGMMTRDVKLERGWYRDAYGAMLGTLKEDGSLIALIPGKFGGYSFFDPKTGVFRRVSSSTAGLISDEAISFYKQFPLRKLHIRDLGLFALGTLNLSDYVFYGIMTLIGTLLGILVVNINKVLMSNVLELGSLGVLIACSLFLICVQLSQFIFRMANELFNERFDTRMDLSVESATIMRILSLPPGFFKEYSSGDLSSRADYIGSLCKMITSAIFGAGFQAVFSLAYISQIFRFAPKLVLPSVIITLVTFAFSVLSTFLTMNVTRRKMNLSAKRSGMSFAVI